MYSLVFDIDILYSCLDRSMGKTKFCWKDKKHDFGFGLLWKNCVCHSSIFTSYISSIAISNFDYCGLFNLWTISSWHIVTFWHFARERLGIFSRQGVWDKISIFYGWKRVTKEVVKVFEQLQIFFCHNDAFAMLSRWYFVLGCRLDGYELDFFYGDTVCYKTNWDILGQLSFQRRGYTIQWMGLGCLGIYHNYFTASYILGDKIQ